MEGKESKSCCPAPGDSCGGSVPPTSKAYSKCGPGWKCEIQKIEAGAEVDTKPFYKCVDSSCVCEEGKETIRVETEGAYCVCGEGYSCKITKTEGPDAGEVFCECGHGYSCQITASGDKVVFKDNA